MFIGDSNESKIRVAEYSTILFQQGQPRFVYNLKQLSNVFKTNRTGIEPESNGNQTSIECESNVNRTQIVCALYVRFHLISFDFGNYICLEFGRSNPS